MLAKVTPNQGLSRSFFDPIDRIFDDVLSTWSIFDRPPLSLLDRSYRLEEVDGKLRYEIDLPGVKPLDVKVYAERDLITVSGNRRGKEFKYQFMVNDGYDVESTAASLDAGILTLLLQPKVRPEPKLIEISVTHDK